MSAFTTINITRTRAKEAFLNRFFGFSDAELEEFMDRLLRDRLYNCRIVNDDAENDDELLS